MPLTLVGLMLIIVGFWGFLMACLIVPGEAWSWDVAKLSTIYGTPTTLSSLSFNILMGFSGGIIGAWLITRDPFWMMSGALAGIIATASGLDIYWPPLAFVMGFAGGALLKPCAAVIERMGIDDAVGAVTVHGTIGLFGLIMLGVWADGFPAALGAEAATISLTGQAIGALVFFLLGFVPALFISLILNIFGLLRVSNEAELAGLDMTKVPASAYPEGIPPSAVPLK